MASRPPPGAPRFPAANPSCPRPAWQRRSGVCVLSPSRAPESRPRGSVCWSGPSLLGLGGVPLGEPTPCFPAAWALGFGGAAVKKAPVNVGVQVFPGRMLSRPWSGPWGGTAWPWRAECLTSAGAEVQASRSRPPREEHLARLATASGAGRPATRRWGPRGAGRGGFRVAASLVPREGDRAVCSFSVTGFPSTGLQEFFRRPGYRPRSHKRTAGPFPHPRVPAPRSGRSAGTFVLTDAPASDPVVASARTPEKPARTEAALRGSGSRRVSSVYSSLWSTPRGFACGAS